MYLNLISDDKKSAVNFDFTKFFSEKGYYIWDPDKKRDKFIKRDSSHYKRMIKNLVEKYVSEENMYEVGIYTSEKVVDFWFRQALEEELTAPQKDFLEENYKVFRKTYKLDAETDKFIEKLNNIKKPIKNKYICWRLILGECACLVTSRYIVVYDRSEGLVEWNISENKAIDNKNRKITFVLKIYEPIVNESKFLFDVSVKTIKMLSKGLDSTVKYHLLQVKGNCYDFSLINTYLNDKELVEVWKYQDMILLRQSDRDIILIQFNTVGKTHEVIRLEDYKE